MKAILLKVGWMLLKAFIKEKVNDKYSVVTKEVFDELDKEFVKK